MSGTENADSCLNEQQCHDFLSGKLLEHNITLVVKHVECCDRCQKSLESLTLPDLELSPNDAQHAALSQALKRSSQVDSPPDSGEATTESFAGLATGVFRTPLACSRKVPEIPGYAALEEIATGGMGTVYRARQKHLGRDVAIKVMRGLVNANAAQRFSTEMLAIGKLEHDHIVRAYDAGEADGIPFLVMELLQGTDLKAFVQPDGPRISINEACKYIRQAGLGLQAAHEAGFVHRDVKPSNLMLTADGTVKLLDLGLVHADDTKATDGEITDEVSIIGSLDYIAPEQGRNTNAADARSDVYSLGCTLFALLTGRAPFSGPEYRTVQQKLLAHACEQRPNVSDFNSNVPQGLSDVVIRMMSIDPAERPQTAAEAAELMTQFVGVNDYGSRNRSVAESAFWGALLVAFGVIITIRLSDGSKVRIESPQPGAAITITDSDAGTVTEVRVREMTPAAPGKGDVSSSAVDTVTADSDNGDYTSQSSVGDISSHPKGALTACVARQMFDGEIYWLQYSPDGSVLYLTGPGDAVQALDPLTGRTVKRYSGHQIESRSLVFNEGQSTMYSTDDVGRILQHNVEAAVLKREVADLGNSLRELDLTPDQRTLVGPVENNGGLFLVDVASGSYSEVDGDYQNVAFDAAGEHLYVSQRGVGLIRRNMTTNQTEVVVQYTAPEFGFLTAQRPTGQAAFIQPPNRVYLLELSTGRRVLEFDTQASDRHRARFSPSGRLLVIGPRSDTATLVSTDDGHVVASLTIPNSGSFRVFRFSPDGKSLAVGMNDGRLAIFDLGERCRTAWEWRDTEKSGKLVAPNEDYRSRTFSVVRMGK